MWLSVRCVSRDCGRDMISVILEMQWPSNAHQVWLSARSECDRSVEEDKMSDAVVLMSELLKSMGVSTVGTQASFKLLY